MPLSYCPLHERCFDSHGQTWVTLPSMYVAMVKPFCDLLDAARIDSSGYMVVLTPCDLCTAVARQAGDEILDPGE
jgi:hypothetical protein